MCIAIMCVNGMVVCAYVCAYVCVCVCVYARMAAFNTYGYWTRSYKGGKKGANGIFQLCKYACFFYTYVLWHASLLLKKSN